MYLGNKYFRQGIRHPPERYEFQTKVKNITICKISIAKALPVKKEALSLHSQSGKQQPKTLKEKSHRPHHHPNQHTKTEERKIIRAFNESYLRYGWDGVYDSAIKLGYKRSFSGMVYAAKRMGLVEESKTKKPPRKHDRRYPEI